MSAMEALFLEIKKEKEKSKEEFDKIKYTRNKNSLKNNNSLTFKSKIVQITSKEQVYEEMKLRFRSDWKSLNIQLKLLNIYLGPAYLNKEFSSLPILRNQGLTEWELFKAIQPDRAFYYPKG